MIAEIWKVAKTVVQLADDLKKYHAEIKEVRQDVLKITMQLQRLSDEIELLKQREAAEREKMELRLRIWQLEFEKKQLPAAKPEGSQDAD